MKRTFLIAFLTLLPMILGAQVESEAYQEISAKFENLYNSDQYQEIFDLFSDQMQTALPIEKTTEFLTGLKNQVGKMHQSEFIKYENGISAFYKTNFERATLGMTITLDHKSKTSRLYVKPYVENNLATLERNITPLGLPFKDEWAVFWGGKTKELNYHVKNKATGALCFLQNSRKRKLKTDHLPIKEIK